LSGKGNVLHDISKFSPHVFMDSPKKFRTSASGRPRCCNHAHVNIAHVFQSMSRIRQNTITYTSSAIHRPSSCPSSRPRGHGDDHLNEPQYPSVVVQDMKVDMSTSALDVFKNTEMFVVTSLRTCLSEKTTQFPADVD
jgi:hypothetical protein